MRRVAASRSTKLSPSTSDSRPCADAAPEIHLEQPVLRLHEALREKQIVLVLRVDVRHAPAIAHDAHGLAESRTGSSVPDTCGERRDGSGSGRRRRRRHAGAARTPSRHTSRRSRVRLKLMAIRDALLAEFDHETATTRRLLERIPDERLTWKPHEKSMSLGGIATHLANIPNWGTTILDEPSFDLASAPPNQEAKGSRAEILTAFDAADQGRTREDGQDRRRVPRALGAQARRTGNVHDAEGRGVSNLRPVPPRAPSRSAQRVSAPQQRARAGHLRAVGRRRVTQDPVTVAFVPRPWLASGHRMTLYSWGNPRYFPRLPPPVRRYFDVDHDARVVADCHWQAEPWTRPTIVALHGLNGSSDAHYMRGIAAKAFARGMNVVRLNQRNCGDTEHLSAGLFHSGPDGRRRARRRRTDRGRWPARDRRRRLFARRQPGAEAGRRVRRRPAARTRRRRRRVADHRDRGVREGAGTAGQRALPVELREGPQAADAPEGSLLARAAST